MGTMGSAAGGTSSRRGRTALLAVVLATGMALAGCGSNGGSSGAGAKDTLTVDTVLDQSLDPAATTRTAPMLNSTWPVYDRLLNVGESGDYLPMLATKWTFSKNGRTLDLQLREGVTFSDGTAFDATAVKANIERYRTAPASKAATALITDVTVAGPHEVRLSLARPDRAILNSLAQPAPGAMVSPQVLDAADLATHPVGTGAWVIESFRPGAEVVYTRRTDTDGIWDPASGKVERIVLRARAADASNNELRTGAADIVPFYGDRSAVADVLDSGAATLRPTPSVMTIISTFMRSDVAPFDDVRVRRAVNLAIDRQAIVDAFQPTTTPRVQPFPSVVNGFDPALEKTYPHDPSAAKRLLAEAIQSQLDEVGIRIKLQSYDIGQLVTHYGKSDAAGMIGYLASTSVEPGTDLAWLLQNPLYLPGGGLPPAMAARLPAVDDPAASEQQRARRAAAVVTYATEQALYAPILQGIPGFLLADRVQGLDDGTWLLAPYAAQDFRHVSLND